MKALWKWIARIAFYAVAVGLFIYAASRSLDFITATLPPSQRLLGYLGLLATSGGAVSWLAVYLYHAQGTGQKAMSVLFVVIDLLGEFALFTFDTLYRTGEAGMTASLSPDEIRLVVLALSALVALNLGGTIVFHLLDPETSKRMREESAKDTLDDEVLKAIESRAPQIAEAIAPQIAAQWEADFSKRFGNMAALGLGRLQAPETRPALPAEAEAPKPTTPTHDRTLGLWEGWIDGYRTREGLSVNGNLPKAGSNGKHPVPYSELPPRPLPDEGEDEE